MMRPSVWIALAVLALAPPPLVADPAPIVRGLDGNWTIDGTFADSGLSVELRRFAQIPNNSNGAPARINKMTYAPGVDGLFVVNSGESGDATSQGILYHVSPDGSTVHQVLDVSNTFTLPRNTFAFNQQGGLRSATFHPQFTQQGTPGYGKLYTTQSVLRPADTSGLNYLGPMNHPDGGNNSPPASTIVDGSVVEWTASFDAEGNFAGVDEGSARELYRVHTPERQHPIKEAAFNPFSQPGDDDYGLLYVLHPEGRNTNGATAGTGQVGSDAMGKLVRIDPLGGVGGYSIPVSNPFVGSPSTLDEVYALGLRDPHTIAFAQDDQGGSHMLVSDIGGDVAEEINLITPGGNYGWSEREGTFAFPFAGDLPAGDAAFGYTYPVAQYGHSGGGSHAVAGGFVVRDGTALDGQYLFGDFGDGDAPLMIFSFDEALSAETTGAPAALTTAEIKTLGVVFDHDDNPSTPPIPKTSVLDVLNDEPTYDNSGRTDIRFGQGPAGELYLMNKRNGWVYTVTIGPVFGDLTGDGILDSDDWIQFRSGQGIDMMGLSAAEAAALGDLDGDFDNDLKDFRLFKNAYLQRNGVGSFTQATGSTPEPSSALLLLAAMLAAMLAALTKDRARLVDLKPGR